MSNIVWIGANANNYNTTRLGYPIRGIIIHTIVGSLQSADAAFNSPTRQASAHYGVECDGSVIHQWVREADTAWHCGRYYPDAADPLSNVNTIGIEHCDGGQPLAPRSDGLYACSAQLVKEVCARYGIPINRTFIRKHTEVSVLYTACPDTLDIDRIVAMANGTYNPPQPTGDDDMLYVGPFQALPGAVKPFANPSNLYSDPSTSARVLGSAAVAQSLSVSGYLYSSSAVQSSDLDGHGTAGPDLVWWKLAAGGWVADAGVDSTGIAGAPQGTVLSSFPAGMTVTTYFAVAGTTGGPDDDSAFATKAYVDQQDSAVKAGIPTKATTTLA